MNRNRQYMVFLMVMMFALTAFAGVSHGAPSVISVDPGNNNTRVSLNKTISAMFSEVMDTTTITGSTFYVYKDGTDPATGTIPATVTTATSSGLTIANLKPNPQLEPDYRYKAEITTAVRNPVGVALTAKYTWSFTTIHDTPPTLAVTVPADNSTTTNATSNVTGSVSAAGNIGIRSLTVNGSAVTVNADGTFSHAVTLSNGANTITVKATDNADLTTTVIRTVTLDPGAPVLAITTPADNSKTSMTYTTISGTVGSATTTVSVTVNGGPSQSASVTDTAFSITVNLSPGSNAIVITATSLLGKTASASRTVFSDSQAPSLAITDPSQDITTSENNHTIRGTVADALSSVTLTIEVDSVPLANSPAAVNGVFEQRITYSGQKTHTVKVKAVDEVGNEVSVQRNIIYSLPDLNGDGIVNIADAVLLMQIAVGFIYPTSDQLAKGDVAPLINGRPSPDGIIDVGDVIVMLKKVVGLITW
jgi:hypothetical protein